MASPCAIQHEQVLAKVGARLVEIVLDNAKIDPRNPLRPLRRDRRTGEIDDPYVSLTPAFLVLSLCCPAFLCRTLCVCSAVSRPFDCSAVYGHAFLSYVQVSTPAFLVSSRAPVSHLWRLLGIALDPLQSFAVLFCRTLLRSILMRLLILRWASQLFRTRRSSVC